VARTNNQKVPLCALTTGGKSCLSEMLHDFLNSRSSSSSIIRLTEPRCLPESKALIRLSFVPLAYCANCDQIINPRIASNLIQVEKKFGRQYMQRI
jgi:hypothetical protein